MAKQLLPLCSIPKVAMRDGYTGLMAKILLPFYSYGYWFASGQQYTFPGSTLLQDTSRVLGGIDMPDDYQKAAGICIKG
jgi:hypothetical protein